VSFILYLHRFFPAFAERSIKEEKHLSDGQVGLLLFTAWSAVVAFGLPPLRNSEPTSDGCSCSPDVWNGISAFRRGYVES
jgi:hypothetical protein